MAAGKTEQLDISTKSSFRKMRAFIKRATSKTARRAGKKLLQDAPPLIMTGGCLSKGMAVEHSNLEVTGWTSRFR